MKTICLAPVALTSLIGGCVGLPEAPDRPDPVSWVRFEVKPGASEELCFLGATGSLVTYRFEADGPLVFDVHYHAGDAVYYPVPAHRIAAEKGQLRIPSSQTYCLMWTNEGSTTINLSTELVGAGDIVSH